MSYFNLDKPNLLGNALSASLFIEPQYSITNRYVFGIRAQAGFVAESRKYDFNIPNISIAEIKGIAASLEEMRDEIVDRVKSI